MNAPDPRILAETAALKRILGAALSEDERAALDDYTRTTAGSRFVAEAEAVAGRLRSLRDAPAPADPAVAYAARIEGHVRREAREFRSRFLQFCLGVLGFAVAGAVVPVVWMGHDFPTERVYDLWILMGGFFVVTCTVMWFRTRRVLRSDGVLALIRAEDPSTRSTANKAISWLVLILVSVPVVRRWGVEKALPGMVGVFVVLWLLARAARKSIRKTRLREDADAWGWWYDE